MNRVLSIKISKIQTNPLQPRRYFDENSIDELAQSIKNNGLIQPIVVRPILNGYSLIAGERRLRAFIKLNYEEIPAYIIEVSENQAENFALIENIQRMDLSPIEEALAYQTLIASQKITQQELANKIGKSQSAVANKLRLLQLDKEVLTAVAERKITERHGRCLLSVEPEKQKEYLKKIINEKLNVAQTEGLVKTGDVAKSTLDKNKVSGRATQIQLGINTINEAIKMVETIGINVEVLSEENDNEYRMIIKFKK